jgi:hypothetical protein
VGGEVDDDTAMTVGTMGGGGIAPPAGRWRVDIPEPGTEASVWKSVGEVEAVWTGRRWVKAKDWTVLYDVTHWRER